MLLAVLSTSFRLCCWPVVDYVVGIDVGYVFIGRLLVLLSLVKCWL